MNFTRNFTQSFQRWRQGRAKRGSGDDTFDAAGPGAGDEGRADKDATDRFRRKRNVDYEAVFKEPAQRSRSKHRASGQFCDPLVVEMLLDFWGTFFDCFREDERSFELEQFREEAAELQGVLDQLGPEGVPDLVTARQMLYLLSRFSRMRFESWNTRFEDMLAQQRALKQELEGIKLTSCWQTDEINHCKDLVTNAIRQRDMRVPRKPDGIPPTLNELICALLGIQAQPPKPQAHTGRVRRQTLAQGGGAKAEESAPQETPSGEIAIERKATAEAEAEGTLLNLVLNDVLRGKVTLAKLNKVIDDRDLARKLLDMSAEFHRNRGILSRVGLLPMPAKETDPATE